MSNEYKDWINDFSEEEKKNYDLCIKYPFLVPRDMFGEEDEDYDYSYTHLDSIPTGWRIAFGEQWASDVQSAINKLPEDERDKIYVLQLKEKFGQLRQYFSNYTDELIDVFYKYEDLSERTCIGCGAHATKISQWWISPWCDKCAEKVRDKFVSVDEWFKDVDKI